MSEEWTSTNGGMELIHESLDGMRNAYRPRNVAENGEGVAAITKRIKEAGGLRTFMDKPIEDAPYRFAFKSPALTAEPAPRIGGRESGQGIAALDLPEMPKTAAYYARRWNATRRPKR